MNQDETVVRDQEVLPDLERSPRVVEGLTQRLVRYTAKGRWLPAVCAFLGLICSLCAFPVIPVIISATLMSPRRWRSVAASVAFGCSVGAVVLLTLFHFLGWAVVYNYFPEFLNQPASKEILDWVISYGGIGLFVIAISPLPEMPALIVLGVAKPDFLMSFIAVLAGKTIKYGLISWLASYFPDKFANGLSGFLRYWRNR